MKFEHKVVRVDFSNRSISDRAFEKNLQEVLDQHRDWRLVSVAVSDIDNKNYTLFFTREN